MTAPAVPVSDNDDNPRLTFQLRLYIAGQTEKSVAAISNLGRICETYLAGRYSLEVIDLREAPHLAIRDQILAIPTLVRRLPSPIKKIIGDLSNEERVLVGLDIQSRERDVFLMDPKTCSKFLFCHAIVPKSAAGSLGLYFTSMTS
ncbi:circadian clock KaiB family protein [Asticcacaulis sp. AC402]|uniref:circadian clock KaiB family protein n=1 Tax=Asticcacaulis sp. AC402 TaxID=1282361 RepID=UPI0003C41157|nr:circadian clock KaiB family protein [Asticcacaulis sp. AC402]ESQ75371.1 hypothetical protein ABAC402_09715 [Asticcacaulis sp. AC402]